MIFRLFIAACCAFMPAYGMHKKRRLSQQQFDLNVNEKAIQDGIYRIVVGDSRDAREAEEVYSEIRYVLYDKRSCVANIPSAEKLRIKPFIMQLFLKALVIKGDAELLSPFLALYERSYPSEGINFTYKFYPQEKRTAAAGLRKDKEENQPIPYTLYDVAEAAFLQLRANEQSTEQAQKTLQILIDHGVKAYKNTARKQKSPLAKSIDKIQTQSKDVVAKNENMPEPIQQSAIPIQQSPVPILDSSNEVGMDAFEGLGCLLPKEWLAVEGKNESEDV